ncbi:unnamed protein product [Phytomonas sp. EM1]|nr:unnamed protein product [Phytomonas sp. EM1]|eukprot:CCW60439.1 unnamed protein product [Phytomonas sp. isolate EM1]
MTILSTPFISCRHGRWDAIADGLNCFCIQENATRQMNEGQDPCRQNTASDNDLKPFRIIYTNKSSDLSKLNGKLAQPSNKHGEVAGRPTEGLSGAADRFNPTVVAVSDNVEDILKDWVLILKAGLTANNGRAALSFDSKGDGDHQAWRLELFIEKVWKPLYTNIQGMLSHRSAEVTHGGGEKESPHRSKREMGALPPLAQGSLTPKMDMGATTGSASIASTSEVNPHDATVLGNTGQTCSSFYDVYDVVILRLWDLWEWRDPQHTALVLLALILGGVLYGSAYLCNSAATGLVLLFLSIPLTSEQRWRLREAPKTIHDGPSHVLSPSVSTLVSGDQKVRSWAESYIACDANRMRLLANFFSLPSKSFTQGALKANPESSSNSGIAQKDNKQSQVQKIAQQIGLPSRNAAAIEKLLQSYFGRIFLVYVLMQLLLGVFLPYYSISLTLDTLVAPLVGASMLITGLSRLRPTLFAALKRAQTKAYAEGWLPKPMEKANPVVNKAQSPAEAPCDTKPLDTSSVFPQAITKPPPLAIPSGKECPSEEKATDPPSQPHSSTASGPIRETSTKSRDQTHLYCLPALTDKETAIVEQLTNYGAPFSMVLLKPIREWNQESGWSLQWERRGLRCEERLLGGGSGDGFNRDGIAMRFTARIPNANVGTFQAVLLDDPDFLDTKDTFAYQYTPLLTQNCVVKRLGYNLMILLSRYRSPIHEEPPLELLRYLSPSILLDPDQQEALRLRRPYVPSTFSSANPIDGGYNATAKACGGVSKEGKPLMAFVQCGIPCPQELHPTPPCQPPHCRGPTEMFAILGLEEVDGSLTMGLCTSFKGADVYSVKWAPVFRSVMERKAFYLAELLKRVGPMPNQLAVYRNERYFQPFLKRQPLSQVETSSTLLTEKQSGSTPNPMMGSAFLTADLKLSNVPPGTLIQRTSSAKNLPNSSGTISRTLSLMGSVSKVALTSASEVSVMERRPWPHLVERFVKELLTATTWRREGGSEHVVLYTGLTLFTAAKAYCTVTFAADAKLSVAENVIHLNQFAHDRDIHAKRQITITSRTLEELLVDAAPEVDAGGVEAGGGGGGGGRKGPSPRPDFVREAYHGFTLRFTQFHHETWGLPAVDTVTRVGEPYYCLAKDALATLLSPAALTEGPLAGLAGLPEETKMLFCCGEDASGVLPEMTNSTRSRMFLFGHLCWEGAGGGIHLLHCWVSDLSTLIPAVSAADIVRSHLRVIELQREQIMRMSREGANGE